MSGNLELVEVKLENRGFSFYVVNLPDDQLEDKLTFASSPTGLICRMEYQNFLLTEFVINLDRLFHFIADASSGDLEEQLLIREELELAIYKVNPLLDPDKLLLTSTGLVKPAVEGRTGSPLKENPDWNKTLEEFDAYVLIPEANILDAPPPHIMAEAPPTGASNEGTANFDMVEKRWERLNIVLSVRKFSRNDLSTIFGPDLSFGEELHYKIHIIQKCIDKADSVFALCDATGLTDSLKIPALADELYDICIEVNPFLKAEEVDLKKLKANLLKKSRKDRRSPGTKSKRGNGRKFTDVAKSELVTLAKRINARVVGQEEAVEKLVDTIQIASCGLRDPESPIGVYLMCGTTGTGKTLSAKVLAEELCGSRDNMVRIDCSEYTEPHSVQKLIGSPPSYVGYEDGGFLTNAVQDNPFSVVLFDEIEKAHSKLFDVLLQIMDDARLTDGKGNITDFKDCIVLMTSNIGVSESEAVKSTMGFGDAGLLTDGRRAEAIQKALKDRFRPEFLNRIDETLSFRSLGKEDALSVVDLLLEKVKGYLKDKFIVADFTKNVRNMVFDKGFSKKYGARPLERTINKEIIRVLAKKIIKEEIKEGTKIRVDYRKDKLVVREVKSRAKRVTKKPALVKA